MKQSRILKQILASGLFMMVLQWAVGCANIVPPTGGPRDSIPPFLIAAKPKDSSVNIQPKEILVGFNEFITAMDLQNNFIISPSIKTTPLIDARLNMLRIRLNDSLQKNTTYSLQFGNAIRDVNESNIAKNFTYVFSTGNHIDTGIIKGKVQIAETGLVDSTLLVVLHPANNDTAIFKKAPLYYAKINGKGKFEFKFLPPVSFNIFVIPNDYTKKYDDSTKLFAFLDNPIQVSNETDSQFLYVFQSAKKAEKKKAIAANSKKQIKVALQYNKFFEGNEQDILSPLKLGFDQPVKLNDSFPIQLCDTLNKELKNYTIKLDSTKKLLLVDYAWEEKSKLKLIIPAKSITDTLLHTIEKADTIAFKTKSDESYANAVIRLSGYQKKVNPILLLTQDDKIKYSFPITNSLIRIPKLLPGDYVLKLLEDRNKNGSWDNGFYGKTKLQPEIVHVLGNSVNIRTDFDNELNIVINP
jgi:hypothetical protein